MRTLSHVYYDWRREQRAARHLAVPFARADHLHCDAERMAAPDLLDLVSVAFNNDRVIRHQHRLLTKNFQDPFHYTVADNSSDAASAERIREFCRTEGVAYVRLPAFPAADGSASHGQALNWLWRNFLRCRQARWFGFLDHDVFPLRPTALLPLLEQSPIYGRLQERGDRWYLWPGFCFYRSDFCRHARLDFRPVPLLDTGGGNWAPLYSRLEKSSLPPVPYGFIPLRDGADVQADQMETFGDWLHTINASGWKPSGGKNSLVEAYLSRY